MSRETIGGSNGMRCPSMRDEDWWAHVSALRRLFEEETGIVIVAMELSWPEDGWS